MREKIEKLSDKELYQLAQNYGRHALHWKRKFTALLPEVYKRKLYEKHGFSSVFVFAYKLAGLNERQVRLTLNLEKRFQKFPALKKAMLEGEIGLHKLSRVASLATSENEQQLVDLCKSLPKSAIETYVRDVKLNRLEFTPERIVPGGCKLELIETGLLPDLRVLELSEELLNRLLKLKKKGFDLNQLLLEILDKRKASIKEEKLEVRREQLLKEHLKKEKGGVVSRVVPRRVQRVLKKEFGEVCSVSDCFQRVDHLHHTRPFSLEKSHDPYFITPLCKNHHRIAHLVNLKVKKKVMRL